MGMGNFCGSLCFFVDTLERIASAHVTASDRDHCKGGLGHDRPTPLCVVHLNHSASHRAEWSAQPMWAGPPDATVSAQFRNRNAAPSGADGRAVNKTSSSETVKSDWSLI
jgi:hypothetical protein